MKLLLIAAFRNKKHFLLSIITVFTLLFLTVANQMEMFALGLMTNTGADFFVLFGDEKKTNPDTITFREVETKWKKIDTDRKGKITKKSASLYLAKKKDHNPLQLIRRKIGSRFEEFDIDKHFIDLIWLLIGVALFKSIFIFASRYATQVMSIRITRDLRLQFFQHIQSLPLSFYQSQNLGSLTARSVGDAGQIASSLNSLLTNYIQTPFAIVTTFFACVYISWKLSLVIFVGLPLIIIPVMILTRRVKKVSRQMQRNQESFTSVLLDFLSGIQTVKVFAMEAFSLKKFKEQNDKTAQLESKNAKYSLLTRPILHMITASCLAFVVMIGLYSLRMGISDLIIFCGLLNVFYEPVKKFAEENANVQRGVIAAERMFEVLHLKPTIQDKDGAIEFTELKEKIEFDHVTFAYNTDVVLEDLSFTVEKGQTVAIVGPTGAGKSTIVQLLPRLYDIQKGEIRIDGISLRDYSQKSLREKMAFVPQRPFLFFDTVAENISFGENFSREEVIQAAEKAYAHEFIVDLPKDYDTLLAETGKNLSGGQQQRLAIARALVKKAPILIMDEATSSLDSISENRIKMAIQNLHKEVTQILIAHRLSTIEHADKIIYIEKGRKVAEGTKEELLQTSREFRLMWEMFHQTQAKESIEPSIV
jgi:ABC-type multidrug transport system fused ATPase/permease subunit